MAKHFSNIENKLKIFEFVSRARIEFGVLDKDKSIMQTIQVYNLDGTVSEQEMPLSDIMYLTENGTINLPAKKILRRINEKINYEIIASDNVISGLLGQEESQKYTFDLKKLKKFLKSEIFFTN